MTPKWVKWGRGPSDERLGPRHLARKRIGFLCRGHGVVVVASHRERSTENDSSPEPKTEKTICAHTENSPDARPEAMEAKA